MAGMTIVPVVLLGAGAVLIISALDNTPIVTTFQKIISGQPLDLTGTKNGNNVQLPNIGQDINTWVGQQEQNIINGVTQNLNPFAPPKITGAQEKTK